MDSQGKPVNQVSLVRTEGTSGISSSGGQSDGNGRFTFTGVVPGDYTIVARLGNNGNMPVDAAEREVGAVPVHIDGADVENIVVATSKGVSAMGRVIFESGAPPPVKGLRVVLRPARGSTTMMFGPTPNAEVTPDLTFALNGLFRRVPPSASTVCRPAGSSRACASPTTTSPNARSSSTARIAWRSSCRTVPPCCRGGS